jgi:hypothetical protein
MSRIHLGRISAVVAGVVLVGGLANHEVLAAMANPDNIRFVGGASEGQVNLDEIGAFAVLELPDRFPNAGAIQRTPVSCSFEPRIEQRNCRSRSTSADTTAAVSIKYLDATGKILTSFDRARTKTMDVRTAYTVSNPLKFAAQRTRTYKSHRLFSGVESASTTRFLTGADTTFTVLQWPDGRVLRNESIRVYDRVTVPATGGYPTSGTVSTMYTVRLNRAAKQDADLMGSKVTLYFDGTRTPEADIDGARVTVDLQTGVTRRKL